jgi:hypothetical protein
MENISQTKLMEMYLESLNEKELKAYAIAKSFLGSSFQLEKSVGFLKWMRETYGFPARPFLVGKPRFPLQPLPFI